MFQRVTNAIVRKLKSEGCPGVIGYLDDYFIIAQSEAECHRCYLLAQDLLLFLGFDLAPDKLEGPTQDIVFLGIRLETNVEGNGGLKASLTEARVQKVSEMCKKASTQRWMGKKELERLVGTLNWCSQVVWGSRLYLRSAYQLLSMMPKGKHGGQWAFRPFQLDMLQWVKIMGLFNGRGVILNRRVVHTEFFSVDASLLQGMGGFLDGRYFSVSWKELATWKQKP